MSAARAKNYQEEEEMAELVVSVLDVIRLDARVVHLAVGIAQLGFRRYAVARHAAGEVMTL